MAQIGTIKLQTDSGTVDVPVFDTGDSGASTSEALRVQTDSGIGFIPLVDPSDAARPYLRVQSQNNGVVAVHNKASLITEPVALSNLVAWYPFDSSDYPSMTNNADDATSGLPAAGDSTAQDGTVDGATHLSSGGVTDINSGGKSGAFDFVKGNAESIVVTHSGQLTTPEYTRMAFMNPDGFGSSIRRIFSTYADSGSNSKSGYGTFTNGDKTVEHDHFDSDGNKLNLTTNRTVTSKTYTHVATSFDGTTHIIYLNGDQEVSSSTQSGTSTNSANFNIADSQHITDEHFDGQIDDVRHYNKSLSSTDIEQIYKNTKPLQTDTLPVAASNLVAWYPFGPGGAVDETAFDSRFGDTEPYHGSVIGAAFQRSSGVNDINAGANSGAFDFDGTQHIVVPNTTITPGLPMTCMGWAFYDSSYGIIVYSINDNTSQVNSSLGLAWSQDEFIAAGREQAGVKAATTPATGQYFHIAGVFRSNTDIDIYVNGSIDNGGGISDRPGVTELSGTQIGSRKSGSDFYGIDGRIDDVRIYNTELSGSQISQIFQNTKP